MISVRLQQRSRVTPSVTVKIPNGDYLLGLERNTFELLTLTVPKVILFYATLKKRGKCRECGTISNFYYW